MKYRNLEIKWMNALELNRKMITPTHLSGLCCWKWISDLVLIRIISPPFAAAAPTAHILKQNDLIFCQLPRSSFPSKQRKSDKVQSETFQWKQRIWGGCRIEINVPTVGRWPQFSGKAILWIPNTKSGILQKYFNPKSVIFKKYFNSKVGIFQKYFS